MRVSGVRIRCPSSYVEGKPFRTPIRFAFDYVIRLDFNFTEGESLFVPCSLSLSIDDAFELRQEMMLQLDDCERYFSQRPAIV